MAGERSSIPSNKPGPLAIAISRTLRPHLWKQMFLDLIPPPESHTATTPSYAARRKQQGL